MTDSKQVRRSHITGGLRADNAGQFSSERIAEELGRSELDVILRLGSTSPCLDLSTCKARNGIWAIRSARGRADSAVPLGFWEVYADDVMCELQIVSERESYVDWIVNKGRYTTYRWAWNLNAALLGKRAYLLFSDALRREREGIPLEASAGSLELSAQHPPGLPNALHSVTASSKCILRSICKLLHRELLDEEWRILLFEGKPSEVTREDAIILEPPAESYWADPFVVRHNRKIYVFFEEYIFSDRKGVISYVEIDDSRSGQQFSGIQSRRVIEEPHHLSYPFIFRYAGGLYMIPETSEKRAIELWRCIEFPNVWRKIMNLMEEISAVDTSLLQWGNKWWLFTNIDRGEVGDHCSELHVYYSDSPISARWCPHALNPIVVDAGRARMAGGFLKNSDGRPIRCCQVQGKRYGEGVEYCVIEELSEMRYIERPLAHYANVGLNFAARRHHVDFSDGLTVADECIDYLGLRRKLRRYRFQRAATPS